MRRNKLRFSPYSSADIMCPVLLPMEDGGDTDAVALSEGDEGAKIEITEYEKFTRRNKGKAKVFQSSIINQYSSADIFTLYYTSSRGREEERCAIVPHRSPPSPFQYKDPGSC